jgi:calcineurin-like phosphoesterase family protein
MDEAMIASWNSVVRPDDTVIHLGDFAHRVDAHKVGNYFHRPNGEKHLVIGNHDGPETLALPWESVNDIAYTKARALLVTSFLVVVFVAAIGTSFLREKFEVIYAG